MLAVIAWLVVIYQTNPPGQVAIQGVPLAVSGPPAGMVLLSSLPETVNVELQSTRDRIGALTTTSLRAELDLQGLPAGVHSVPVKVEAADPLAQVLSVSPESLDVSLEAELKREITPTVMIVDLNILPPGYVVGEPQAAPGSLSLSGARSLVERVAAARIDLMIGERRADFQDTYRPLLLDSSGYPVEGVQASPQLVVVTVPVRRTSFTRQVGVQPALDEKGLDPNYELGSIETLPSIVTLTGPQAALDSAGAFLVTAPISLTHHYSDFTVEAPLLVPPGLTAVNDQGEMIYEREGEDRHRAGDRLPGAGAGADFPEPAGAGAGYGRAEPGGGAADRTAHAAGRDRQSAANGARAGGPGEFEPWDVYLAGAGAGPARHPGAIIPQGSDGGDPMMAEG